jgi:hypothetical protein
MICAVIDIKTNQLINIIVADVNEPMPDGQKLVEIPEGYYWDNGQVLPIKTERM